VFMPHIKASWEKDKRLTPAGARSSDEPSLHHQSVGLKDRILQARMSHH
jgi:hypothetical protein